MEASLNSPNGRTQLTANTLTIGRSPDNQFVIQDPQASSHHAEIRPDAQGYVLTDLGSTNGTFVNEQRLSPRVPRLLISGEVIRIGSTSLTYEIAGSYDATVRASSGEYANPGYSPTMAAPQPPYSAPGYPDYQQQPSSSPNYPGYPQPSSSPNYPAQPGYPAYQQPSAYSNYNANAAPSYPQAQPGYPPQQPPWAAAPGQYGAPGFQAPAAQAPKKRRTGLIIGIVILLLLVVGGIGGYLYLNRSTPEKTLTAYCTALQNSDAQGVFNQLSAHAQTQTSVQRISQGFQILDAPQIGGVKGCTFSNVQQSGSTATATLVLTAGANNASNPPLTTTDKLVNENGTWKIDQGQVPGQ